MDNNSRTDHDHAVAGVVMEISYRLTAAINIVKFKLESKEWFVNGHDAIRVALTEFISLTEPERLAGQRKHASDHRLMQSVELLSGDISTWTATAGDDDGPSVVRAMLEPLVEARKLLCRMLAVEADNKSDPGDINIIDFWLLGGSLVRGGVEATARHAGRQAGVRPRYEERNPGNVPFCIVRHWIKTTGPDWAGPVVPTNGAGRRYAQRKTYLAGDEPFVTNNNISR